MGFLIEWSSYLDQVEGAKWRSERMEQAKFDKLSGELGGMMVLSQAHSVDLGADEQVGQLYELMKTIRENEDGSEGGETKS
jgi:thymidylate synthase